MSYFWKNKSEISRVLFWKQQKDLLSSHLCCLSPTQWTWEKLPTGWVCIRNASYLDLEPNLGTNLRCLFKKEIKCQLVLSLCVSLNLDVKGHTSLVWGEKHAIEDILKKKNKKPSWEPVLECRGRCMRDWRSVFGDWVEHKLFRFFRFVSFVFRPPWAGSKEKRGQYVYIWKNVAGQGRERSSSVPFRLGSVDPRISDI